MMLRFFFFICFVSSSVFSLSAVFVSSRNAPSQQINGGGLHDETRTAWRGRLPVQQLPICYFCYAKLFHWLNNLAPFFSQSEEKPPLSIKLQEQDIILLVKRNVIGSFEPLRILIEQNGVFSHNVTAAILAVSLVCETNPVGVELFSYVIAFFCLHKCWPRV